MKIVLIGFMATGKSTVGRHLAERLNIPFVDTDQLIENSARLSVAEIFEREGEEGFRRWERWAIKQVAPLKQVVVATGGGAWMDPRNRQLLQEGSRVIWLRASAEEIKRRLESGRTETRPLQKSGDTDQLLAERTPTYRLAPEHIDTSGLGVTAVAEQILKKEPEVQKNTPRPADRFSVQTEPPYDIVIGSEIIEDLPELLRQAGLNRGMLGLSADSVVWSLYGPGTLRALKRTGRQVVDMQFLPGESSKTLENLSSIYDRFLQAGIDRDFTMAALGGGVVGDAAGFAAATLLRGVRYVGIPTTLLSQVDSSVGGKVAVNHPMGKNLIGAFHQPQLVVCDVSTLQTLSDREFQSGMGEVIKHGLISGGCYLDMLMQRGDEIKKRRPGVLRQVVSGSCEIKAGFVAADERDRGKRMNLNFGHTTGHAVESATRGEVPHGIAVGYGMAVAARISNLAGYLTHGECRRIENILRQWNFPTACDELPDECQPEQLLKNIQMDKKRQSGRVRWILLGGIGDPLIVDDVPREMILRAL